MRQHHLGIGHGHQRSSRAQQIENGVVWYHFVAHIERPSLASISTSSSASTRLIRVRLPLLAALTSIVRLPSLLSTCTSRSGSLHKPKPDVATQAPSPAVNSLPPAPLACKRRNAPFSSGPPTINDAPFRPARRMPDRSESMPIQLLPK